MIDPKGKLLGAEESKIRPAGTKGCSKSVLVAEGGTAYIRVAGKVYYFLHARN